MSFNLANAQAAHDYDPERDDAGDTAPQAIKDCAPDPDPAPAPVYVEAECPDPDDARFAEDSEPSDQPPNEQTWDVEVRDGRVQGIYRSCNGRMSFAGRVVETDSGVYPPDLAEAHLLAAAPELFRAVRALLRGEPDAEKLGRMALGKALGA